MIQPNDSGMIILPLFLHLQSKVGRYLTSKVPSKVRDCDSYFNIFFTKNTNVIFTLLTCLINTFIFVENKMLSLNLVQAGFIKVNNETVSINCQVETGCSVYITLWVMLLFGTGCEDEITNFIEHLLFTKHFSTLLCENGLLQQIELT